VAWPPERLPRRLVVNGVPRAWRQGEAFHFEGAVTFGPRCPVTRLEGPVELRAEAQGWRILWTLSRSRWVAAAVAGELGEDAPFEAKRALAAVLGQWIAGGRAARHADGTLCPLTHCAVVRGLPSWETEAAVAQAPRLDLDPDAAFYTGSKGGVSLSPREVWGGRLHRGRRSGGGPRRPLGPLGAGIQSPAGEGPETGPEARLEAGAEGPVPGSFGPYPVEHLRLEAGRRWGWSVWPSNACEAEELPTGG